MNTEAYYQPKLSWHVCTEHNQIAVTIATFWRLAHLVSAICDQSNFTQTKDLLWSSVLTDASQRCRVLFMLEKATLQSALCCCHVHLIQATLKLGQFMGLNYAGAGCKVLVHRLFHYLHLLVNNLVVEMQLSLYFVCMCVRSEQN